MSDRSNRERPLLLGSGLFGLGFGALIDVLVFHHVLQWHHLLSTVYPPDTLAGLRTNVYYDGVFSLVMVGVMLVGIALVWRTLNRSHRAYSSVRVLGSALVGVGGFNLFDGIVDHYLLHVHDVVHGTSAFNPHWIGASLLLLGLGVLVFTRKR